MVVIDHPSFQVPENLDTRIWRYVNFVKFMSMLEVEEGSLHFTRLDKLREEDEFEGLPPNAIQEQIDQNFIQNGMSRDYFDACHEYVRESLPCLVCVNCWHCANDESAAMWKIYGGSSGIAVQSTIQRLIKTLQETRQEIRVGLVKYDAEGYSDLESNNSNFFDLLHWILHKRHSFAYEHELRAVIGDLSLSSRNSFPERGLTVRVPIAGLIESVAIVPGAPPWFGDLVRRMLNRYGLQVRVDEAKRPLW